MEGKASRRIDEEFLEAGPGCAIIYIPPKATQYIENKGSRDLKFLCVVDPAWRKENEET
ncbi:MAG: hypothetical protein V1933_02145 [Candidatus Omnitrophota bacterium]